MQPNAAVMCMLHLHRNLWCCSMHNVCVCLLCHSAEAAKAAQATHERKLARLQDEQDALSKSLHEVCESGLDCWLLSWAVTDW